MSKLLNLAKKLLPDTEMALPIVRGPLRGGSFHANPRVSARKMLGFYESELNPWLRNALAKADVVVDVGANDGYFTFGCAAALRRLGKPVRIIAFEPQIGHVRQLEVARERGSFSAEEVRIVASFVGAADGEHSVALDSLSKEAAAANRPLLKIDVEGAELDVLDGCSNWLSERTMLLIEVHREEFLTEIPRLLSGRVKPLLQVNQRPLPLLGREMRDAANWWLVTSGLE